MEWVYEENENCGKQNKYQIFYRLPPLSTDSITVHLQVWVRLLRLKAAVVTLYVKYLSNKHISYGSNHNVYMYQRLPSLPIKEK